MSRLSRKLTVDIDPQTAERMHRAIEAGDYVSDSDVVRAALDLWAERREQHAQDDAALKTAYEDGVASGEAVAVDRVAFLAGVKAARG